MNRYENKEIATGIETKSLISVVLPNYNGARFVEKAINSVTQQTYKTLEVIVVDDCSSDDSPTLIRELAKKDDRIRLIEKTKNEGVAIARNTGIQMAKGDYIALLDNDDTWEPDKLDRQLKLAKQGADIVFCSYDFIDENEKVIKRPFIVPTEATFRSMLTSCVISCSTAFIKSELLKEHPFKSDYYHEDYALWMELLNLPIVAKGDQKVLMHYRQITGSRSSKKRNAAKERWIIFRKDLKLDIFTSAISFLLYSVKGIIKYYL